ncbi:MAG: peptidoglycan-binding protein [Hyphomonadaceae bacterium]|nr:peptidoglycan-binding protein [Hyphomonadaceae bacterium]
MKAQHLIPGLAAALLATSAFAAPPAVAPSAGTSTHVSAPATPMQSPARASHADLYRRAQQKLKDVNLYTGAIDGTRNAAYVRALERFQREHHLTADGRLNHQTRAALGV